MVKILRTIFFTSVMLLFAFLNNGFSAEVVTLQLKWKHQFQFAGYYAALEKGYYRDAGLEVKILDAKEGQIPSDEVIKGNAQFGVAMSDLIALRAQGFPVVALAVIYQHSPLVLLSPQKNKIDNIHELMGKRIALEAHAEELLAYFESEGVPENKLIILPHEYGVSNLLSGQVDAISAYSTDEPFLLKKQGIQYNILSPRSGGIDFYGDTLFTTQEQIRKKPKQVLSFLNASLKGWQYALANSDEIIDLILSKYTDRHSREHLEFEAQISKQLIMPGVVELGYMNPGRWKHISEVFKKLNKIPSDFSIEGFVYDTTPDPDYRMFYFGFGIALIICLLAFFISARFYKLNKKLRVEIDKRRVAQKAVKKSEKKISTLMGNLPGIAYRCLNDEHFTMIFVSQGCHELTHYDVEGLIDNKEISYYQLIHPDDRERVKTIVNNAVVAFSPFKIVYRIFDKNKNIKWVWEQGRGIYSSNNGLKYLEGFITDITKQKNIEAEREKLVTDLQNAMHEIKTLSGLLPVCTHCKKVRDDKGYWNQIETYISDRADVDFSHGICPDCAETHYPDFELYEGE